MKISNPDLVKLTEIKQYFLEPPLTFKLHGYALVHIVEGIDLLNKYELLKEQDKLRLLLLKTQIENKTISLQDLRKELKITGIYISSLTSR